MGRGMTAARCWWPIDDIDIEMSRAQVQGIVQLERICAENSWVYPPFDPTGWRIEDGEPCLFLVCDLEVLIIPQEETSAA
jgi:hypothetical protein